MAQSKPTQDRAMRHALALVGAACRLAGPISFVDDGRAVLRRRGVITAVKRHDTATLFDWLMSVLSFQGIADRIAHKYIADNGNITWAAVERDLASQPECPKLAGYWAFSDCRYQKTAETCDEPNHMAACPLPVHTLRNGRLNQTAYSLFMFIRDIANGDLVQWIDDQLVACSHLSGSERATAGRACLVEPLREVYGVSDKVVSMAMASLLLGAGARRPSWFDIGTTFVVIDTLVHNFLHRTGILQRFGADHAYGPNCYAPHGCADLIARIADQIDARSFNPDFPRTFPRFVQLAIWRYCSASGFDVCNGNRIRDVSRCDYIYCQLRSRCDRVKLHISSVAQSI
jgi:hypothetical protein